MGELLRSTAPGGGYSRSGAMRCVHSRAQAGAPRLRTLRSLTPTFPRLNPARCTSSLPHTGSSSPLFPGCSNAEKPPLQHNLTRPPSAPKKTRFPAQFFRARLIRRAPPAPRRAAPTGEKTSGAPARFARRILSTENTLKH